VYNFFVKGSQTICQRFHVSCKNKTVFGKVHELCVFEMVKIFFDVIEKFNFVAFENNVFDAVMDREIVWRQEILTIDNYFGRL
jgi:hypothetical protein